MKRLGTPGVGICKYIPFLLILMAFGRSTRPCMYREGNYFAVWKTECGREKRGRETLYRFPGCLLALVRERRELIHSFIHPPTLKVSPPFLSFEGKRYPRYTVYIFSPLLIYLHTSLYLEHGMHT